MTRPTLSELEEYAGELGYRQFNAGAFQDHYEMVGWVCGKNRLPMKDWKAAVRLWRRQDQEWTGQAKIEKDPAVLAYARIGQAKIAAGGYEIGRWYGKVRDAIGPDGLARVKAAMRGEAQA